jgi:hypothetical protein
MKNGPSARLHLTLSYTAAFQLSAIAAPGCIMPPHSLGQRPFRSTVLLARRFALYHDQSRIEIQGYFAQVHTLLWLQSAIR